MRDSTNYSESARETVQISDSISDKLKYLNFVEESDKS